MHRQGDLTQISPKFQKPVQNFDFPIKTALMVGSGGQFLYNGFNLIFCDHFSKWKWPFSLVHLFCKILVLQVLPIKIYLMQNILPFATHDNPGEIFNSSLPFVFKHACLGSNAHWRWISVSFIKDNFMILLWVFLFNNGI